MAEEKVESVDSTPYAKARKERFEAMNITAHEYRNQLIVAAESVKCRLGSASVAIVLGSGLGGFEKKLVDAQELSYADIPFLPQPTVVGHSGKIIVGDLTDQRKTDSGVESDAPAKTMRSQRIMCFSGRLHAYEGYPMYQVVFCARLAYLCGCHTIILTNSSGGCIKGQIPGSVVICDDYIRDVSYSILNHSANDAMFGVRYPRSDGCIDRELSDLFAATAKDLKFPFYRGNYWMVSGPTYETASQIQYLINSGGHCVGMSTVPSIQASSNIGLRTVVLSLATNVAAGLSDEVLDHAVVVANAKKAAISFGNFVEEGILRMDQPSTIDRTESVSYDSTPEAIVKRKVARFYPVKQNEFEFDYKLFPRVKLLSFDKLYSDIVYVKQFVHSIMDLQIEIGVHTMFEADERKKLTSTSAAAAGASAGGADSSSSSSDEAALPSRGMSTGDSVLLRRVQNPAGPVPVWLLHDPFWIDIGGTLDCPITIPLYELSGFRSIASTNSSRKACLTFGILDEGSGSSSGMLVGLVSNLHLDGLSFDEINHVINLIHGTIGHQNLFFMNVFTGFNPHSLYNDTSGISGGSTVTSSAAESELPATEPMSDRSLSRDSPISADVAPDGAKNVFVLASDYVDFHGGNPRYPMPLLPTTLSKLNIDSGHGDKPDPSSSYSSLSSEQEPELAFSARSPRYKPGGSIRFKHGWADFERNRAHQNIAELLATFNDGVSESTVSKHGYGWWVGPSFPSPAECAMTCQAKCSLIGMTNPQLPHLARQMGMDGFNIVCIGDIDDVKFLSSSAATAELNPRSKNVTRLVSTLTTSIVDESFSKRDFRFSPAIMSARTKYRFQAAMVTDSKLTALKGFERKQQAPCYQVLPDVEERWLDIQKACEWLSSKWDFNQKGNEIKNVFFSQFSYPFELKEKSDDGSITSSVLLSVDLKDLPGWDKYFCGGTPYTLYHLNNSNPFGWTLKIYRTGSTTTTTKKKSSLYAVIAPSVFSETDFLTSYSKMAAMKNLYKYLPSLWNLEFIVRVMWKLGALKVCFLAQLFGTNNELFGLSDQNGPVLIRNFIEATKWNTLTGPNDERMGARFVPMTEPVELVDSFQTIVRDKNDGRELPSVLAVHVSPHALVSPLSKEYYAGQGIACAVTGLIPCIQTASHVGLKKIVLGIHDFHPDVSGMPKLAGIGDWQTLLDCVEAVFDQCDE